MEAVPDNPFKGLRPYSQQDRDKLFGRDRDLILMKDRIFSGRTTLLFAGSGVGKTSFLNAKIIPELKKQCVVVWQNRWTGADEVSEASAISEARMRWWRPRTLIRELVRKFRAYREGELSVSPSKRDGWEKTDDPFETQVRQIISQSLRRNSGNEPQRLSQILAGFRRSAQDSSGETSRCILILDQFEEVFQYHAYEDYFGDFVKDLCEIINNDDYQVRVVFSMREEFLGELSVFDNKIPDLFSNYYRLRYPDKDEAEDIIRRTCQLSGVNPDETNLVNLVEDLSKIAKGSGSFAERAANPGKASVHVIKRNFVAPPYLQIACERLWTKQYPPDEKRGTLSAVTSQTSPAFSPFLIGYQSDNGGAGKAGQGGDARRAVVDFCEEKLSPPYLNRNEQNIIARAFSFLVTKQGAKMAYELNSLAEHMGGERVSTLKTTLEKLSQDDAKILRESRGPDRAYWFELYHDMYATIVDEWKVRYLAARRRRYWRRSGYAALILILFLVFLNWGYFPFQDRRKLVNFQTEICGANEQNSYGEAITAFTSLRNTLGYRRSADSLWAHILEQRAQCFERKNDPSSALLSLLKAATMESNASEQKRFLKAANVLMGAPNGSLITTYCDDCSSVSLSPDSKTVLGLDADGHVQLWDADTGMPLGPPFCDECSQSRPAARKAIFSTDGKQILTVSGLARCDLGQTDSPGDSRTQTGLSIQLWDANESTPLLAKPICLTDSVTESTQQAGPAIGKEGASAKPQDAPPSIDIRAFAKVGKRFWIAGVRGKEIHVWDEEGGERTVGVGKNPPSVGVTFTPDGLYLAGLFTRESIKFWSVSETEIKPHPFKNVLALAFGPNHEILAAEKENLVSVIDLDAGKPLVSINPVADALSGTQLQNIGFDPTGQQFLTRARDDSGDTIQTWRTATGAPLYKPLVLSSRASRTGLSPDGQTLLAIADGDPPVIAKWDLQTGRLIGVMKRKFDTATFRSDRKSILLFAGTTARLWGVDSGSEPTRLLQGENIDPYEITPDGKALITINDSTQLQFWNNETAAAVAEPVRLNSTIVTARISDDGNYAATATADGLVRVWQPGKSEPLDTFRTSGVSEAMAFSKDGKLLARAVAPDSSDVAKDSSAVAKDPVVAKDLKIRTLGTGTEITLQGHTSTINDVTLTSRLALTGSDDKTARIWNPVTGASLYVLNNADAVRAVALDAGGRLALTGGNDGMIRLWDAQTGLQIGKEISVKEPVAEITFSSDASMGAALTPSWIYLFRVDENGMTYERGTLIADPWQPIFALMPGAKKIRFAYQFGVSGVQLQDFDLDSNDLKEFGDDAKEALDHWQYKLGLSVGELGQITRLWQKEPSPATPQSYQQSRQAGR